MQTTNQPKTPKKKTSATTAATLNERREETRRGRESLASLEAERTTATGAYAEDMSAFNRGKLEEIDARIREANTTLEAFETREHTAEREHASMVTAEKRAELAHVTDSADVDALERELVDLLVTPALAFDREQGERIDIARGKLRAHRERVARARALGGELGIDVSFRDLAIDDVRVVAGVAISAARRVAATSSGAEHFVTSIESAYVRDEKNALVPNPLCTAQQFEAATAFVARKNP